jgi:hypothetical protein
MQLFYTKKQWKQPGKGKTRRKNPHRLIGENSSDDDRQELRGEFG